MAMWFNDSLIPDEDLSPSDPQFWDRPTPVSCDAVRTVGISMCIAAFVGVVLNGGLVVSFIRYKVLRSAPNIYVMFISIMGLFASLTILPATGISSIYCQWLFQRRGCQITSVIAFLYGCASSYLLCVVSLSRCFIIVRPFDANKITVRKSVIVSCFAVLLAFTWSMLPVLGWNEYVMEEVRTSCCINWYDRRFSYVSFTFFLFTVVYLFPLIILVVSNTITLIGLKKMHNNIKQGVKTVLNRKRIQMEQRIVRSIIITTGGFIFTWSPYAVILFVSAFRGKDYAIPPLITFYCACFAKSSVIWIPLLYISTSTQFRFSFVDVQSAKNLAASNPKESNQGEDAPTQKLNVVLNDDGSVVIRAVNQITHNQKSLLLSTDICHV